MRRPPYAPFRAGPPDFVVGLKPIPIESWIAPDIEAASLPAKRALLSVRRGEVFRALPGSELPQAELEQMIARVSDGAQFADEAPLVRAAALVSDDLVLLAPCEEGWRAMALVLCSPTFFSAEEAIGKSLLGLHAPVPDRLGRDGAQGLGERIGRMFVALREGLVLERFNWTVQATDARFTPDGALLRARAAEASDGEALDLLHLRVERQTIRALPESGAIVFTIRISLDPLRAVFAETGARDAFADAWAGAGDHVRGYKKWAAYERLVRAALTAP